MEVSKSNLLVVPILSAVETETNKLIGLPKHEWRSIKEVVMPIV